MRSSFESESSLKKILIALFKTIKCFVVLDEAVRTIKFKQLCGKQGEEDVKMKKRAYIVLGETGYSSKKRTWPVRVFLDEEKVKGFTEKATALVEDLVEEYDEEYNYACNVEYGSEHKEYDMDDIECEKYCKYDPDLLDNHIANTVYDYYEVPLTE